MHGVCKAALALHAHKQLAVITSLGQKSTQTSSWGPLDPSTPASLCQLVLRGTGLSGSLLINKYLLLGCSVPSALEHIREISHDVPAFKVTMII